MILCTRLDDGSPQRESKKFRSKACAFDQGFPMIPRIYKKFTVSGANALWRNIPHSGQVFGEKFFFLEEPPHEAEDRKDGGDEPPVGAERFFFRSCTSMTSRPTYSNWAGELLAIN
jgi:hypothetical protein